MFAMIHLMRIRIANAILLAALSAFGIAAAAASAAPGTAQYTTASTPTTNTGGVLPTHTAATHAATGTVHTSSTLPFTGISLVWIVALGVMLLVLGLVLRRRGRSSSS
jgi:LPXTG-motif cell wall-anchored protein